MHVLGRMLEGLAPGGIVLDLQVIRPDPYVETGGRRLCTIDGEPLFRWADAATAAVDARVAARELVDEAVDDHDVRSRYSNGAELVADRARSRRPLAPESVAAVAAIDDACDMVERCRLRRLRLTR